MTTTRLLANDRIVSMATVAMTLVALTTALTELDGKMHYVTVFCVVYHVMFIGCICVRSCIKLFVKLGEFYQFLPNFILKLLRQPLTTR